MTDQEARTKAHEVLGDALACGPDPTRDADHSHCCDRLTALLTSHAVELAAVKAELDDHRKGRLAVLDREMDATTPGEGPGK